MLGNGRHTGSVFNITCCIARECRIADEANRLAVYLMQEYLSVHSELNLLNICSSLRGMLTELVLSEIHELSHKFELAATFSGPTSQSQGKTKKPCKS